MDRFVSKKRCKVVVISPIEDPYMTLEEVCATVKLSRTEIMGDGSLKRPGRVALGTFPKPTRLGKHPNSKLVWRRSWIIKWMEEQDQNGYDFVRKAANYNEPEEDAA